jgi:hypothetical protein
MNSLHLGDVIPTQNALNLRMHQQTLIAQDNMSTIIKDNIPTVGVANLTKLVVFDAFWIEEL